MHGRSLEKLEQVARLLDELDREQTRLALETRSSLFAAFRECDGGRSMKLSGNAEGLTHVARKLIQLALHGKPGSHQHYGEGDILDVYDRELILAFEDPDPDAAEGE